MVISYIRICRVTSVITTSYHIISYHTRVITTSEDRSPLERPDTELVKGVELSGCIELFELLGLLGLFGSFGLLGLLGLLRTDDNHFMICDHLP